jgi:hypothetical protein
MSEQKRIADILELFMVNLKDIKKELAQIKSDNSILMTDNSILMKAQNDILFEIKTIKERLEMQ